MARKISKKGLLKKAQSEFSQYIRRRGADYYGINTCFTCGTKVHWKDANAGHYQHNKLDFDEMNMNCQCVYCNKYQSGKLDNYTLNLIKKYGIEKVEDLKLRAKREIYKKYSREELQSIYEKYKGLNDKIN